MIQRVKNDFQRLWVKVKKRPKTIITLTILVSAIVGFLAINEQVDDYVISVNGRRISHTRYTEELQQREYFFRQANQDIDNSTLRRDVIGSLIDHELIAAYAEDNEITVKNEEIEQRYQQIVLQYNNEEELLTELSKLYGSGKPEYMQIIYHDLLREKVVEHLGSPINQWLEDQKNTAVITTNLD